MARKSKRVLRLKALHKAEGALSAVDDILKRLLTNGYVPNVAEGNPITAIVQLAMVYSQVGEALAAIDATYSDPAFTTKQTTTIRRMATAGSDVLQIQKTIRKNTNRIVRYMRQHGLQRKVRTSLNGMVA